MSTITNVFGWIGKSVITLIMVSAMIFASCEAVDGPGSLADGDAALSASRSSANIVGININNAAQLALIGTNPAFPANGNYDLTTSLTLPNNWTPICGPNAGADPFTGTFNGHGYTITVTGFDTGVVSSGDYLGIFAVIGNGAASPVISDLTVNISTNPIVSATADYVGGLAGMINKAELVNITVTGSLVDTYTAPVAPSWNILQDGDTFHVLAAPGEGTILYVGGIGGYITNTTVQNSTNNAYINAVSRNTAVYVGGIAGYGSSVRITGASNSGNIVGNGPGYSSAAGGIVGYLLASVVSRSSSSGTVDLTALGKAFSWDDSWQVYAGGLIGYAGGTVDTATLIQISHATGAVTAYAPFPYAGGLVGYNYGYNDFVSTEGNGTVIRRSYATGEVTAIAQQDPNSVYGDIPYAGGLVGYSSIAGSLIEDSYARGTALAETTGTFAWAGGLIGGNARNSIVNRTYATGEVHAITGSLPPIYPPDDANAGPAAGGIAGYNYFTSATTVRDSVALNQLVHGNQTSQNVVHRVVGDIGSGPYGALVDNLANEDMKVGDNWTLNAGANLPDGANTVAQPTRTIYEGLTWDFGAIWTMGGDNYPILQWQ